MLTIKDVIHKKGKIYYDCLCDCGNRKTIRKSDIMKGTKSCGCWARLRASKLNKKYNTWEFIDDIAIGRTNNQDIEFIIDKEDYDKCKDICWYADYDNHVKNYYIRGTKDKRHFALSHFILDKDSTYIIDHKNHNTTDNRKENLRLVTSSHNAMNRVRRKDNTSGVTGVRWHKATQKWQADICVDSKHIYLGVFSDKNQAIKVRKEAENKYFGKYSLSNSMSEDKNENSF